jgi:alpha-L-rhamnosidase
MDLKKHFITVDRPFKEGTVEVFEQQISTNNIKKAMLTITALGVYEANINNQKVGDVLFAPGYTYYPLHLNYQTYDVTSLLSDESILTVYLGQGWYCGRFTCDNKTQIYGSQPAVSWVLTVEHDDGSTDIYTSEDDNVKTVKSPYAYAGMYDGEQYFAEGAFAEQAFAELAKGITADEVIAPTKFTGKLPENFEPSIIPVRIQEEMPVKMVTDSNGVTILDFGQNFAGMVEIDPAYMEGNTLKLRHGEILNPDGSLYTTNLRKAKAEIEYNKGTETTKYRPRFCYMGFRYVELSGVEYVPGLITAYAIYSEMEPTGSFSCESKYVNQLFENQIWGQKSNYVEVPTDCPQRDERMGYTGDGQVFALTGAYNYDTEIFWSKFLKDIRYSQMDNSEGYVAPTIPAQGPAGIGFLNMLGWGNCVTIVPEMLYWQYGTDCYIKEQYESMKAFVECEIQKMGDVHLWLGVNLGDWLMLGKDVAWMAQHNNPVSNSFIVNDLRILSWAAAYLGKTEDATRYTDYLEKVRAAYIAAFVKEDGFMPDDYQGAYIMALKFVIPKGDLWNKVFSHLITHIRENGMQTGFFATEHILPILVQGNESKMAYDLLLQEGCPGWMYQILRGATTTWERWDALRPDGTINESKMSDDNMVSFNHYAFGSVGKFYYQNILGITPLEPGYEKIRISPVIDTRLGKVTGCYKSRKGLIKVSWAISGDEVHYHITTPGDTEIILLDGRIENVSAGIYEFSAKH